MCFFLPTHPLILSFCYFVNYFIFIFICYYIILYSISFFFYLLLFSLSFLFFYSPPTPPPTLSFSPIPPTWASLFSFIIFPSISFFHFPLHSSSISTLHHCFSFFYFFISFSPFPRQGGRRPHSSFQFFFIFFSLCNTLLRAPTLFLPLAFQDFPPHFFLPLTSLLFPLAPNSENGRLFFFRVFPIFPSLGASSHTVGTLPWNLPIIFLFSSPPKLPHAGPKIYLFIYFSLFLLPPLQHSTIPPFQQHDPNAHSRWRLFQRPSIPIFFLPFYFIFYFILFCFLKTRPPSLSPVRPPPVTAGELLPTGDPLPISSVSHYYYYYYYYYSFFSICSNCCLWYLNCWINMKFVVNLLLVD